MDLHTVDLNIPGGWHRHGTICIVMNTRRMPGFLFTFLPLFLFYSGQFFLPFFPPYFISTFLIDCLVAVVLVRAHWECFAKRRHQSHVFIHVAASSSFISMVFPQMLFFRAAQRLAVKHTSKGCTGLENKLYLCMQIRTLHSVFQKTDPHPITLYSRTCALHLCVIKSLHC